MRKRIRLRQGVTKSQWRSSRRVVEDQTRSLDLTLCDRETTQALENEEKAQEHRRVISELLDEDRCAHPQRLHQPPIERVDTLVRTARLSTSRPRRCAHQSCSRFDRRSSRLRNVYTMMRRMSTTSWQARRFATRRFATWRVMMTTRYGERDNAPRRSRAERFCSRRGASLR